MNTRNLVDSLTFSDAVVEGGQYQFGDRKRNYYPIDNRAASLLICLAVFFAVAANGYGDNDTNGGARLAFYSLVRALSIGPDEQSNLNLSAPIERWDEAIPLGNGLLGGLLWGKGNNLKLSLDRGDLWDLRRPDIFLRPDWNYHTLQRLVEQKKQDELSQIFEDPYGSIPYPTKLPVGRLELTLPADRSSERFILNLKDAVAGVELNKGRIEAFYSASSPAAMLRIEGATVGLSMHPSRAVETLGFPDPILGTDGDYLWSVQETGQNFSYAVVVKKCQVGDDIEIALTITRSQTADEAISIGKKIVDDALAMGFKAMLVDHRAWWTGFWSESSVRVPDPSFQQHYDLVQYFYGAASRRGAPPIPLQGVWTADEETLPPWKGDYHHDLNTQLTYWAYLAAGHFEEGAVFLDFMWNLLPEHRRFAESFFDAPGAAVPGVMTLDGKAMGGWAQYSLSPTNGAWVAQAFYLHWRYTMDRLFLRERAYPYMTALAECFEALLKPGPDGEFELSLSSSPEIHRNSLKAWLTPNSNYDLALLRWHFGVLVEMADELGDNGASQRWRANLRRLGDLAVEPDTSALRISPDESLSESHRHHSHLLAIHPLGLISIEGSERERKIVEASLAQAEQLGESRWCGYSFSWMACIAARAGKPELAFRNLHTYLNAFVSRNGFHLNGDQTGGTYSNYTYRPFTMEGNFAAAQAIHEMLLQSWGGVIRIFPAIPVRWHDATFHRLRAEGGFEVSAQRRKGQTQWICVRANHEGKLKLRDPFEGKPVDWNGGSVRKQDLFYFADMEAGDTLEGRIKLSNPTSSHARPRTNASQLN